MEIIKHDPSDWEDFEAAARRPIEQTSRIRNSFIHTHKVTHLDNAASFLSSTRWKPIANGAETICRIGWATTATDYMAAFEFRNAQELGRVFRNHGVKYLFFWKIRSDSPRVFGHH